MANLPDSPADFPQVWQKPSFEELLACLKSLHVEPPIWKPTTSRKIILENRQDSARFRREVTTYLSSVVSSSFAWIEDDDQKEVLWDEASKRLSERCGRVGMGEIVRRWPFENRQPAHFELIIREPPMTGDSIGHKTWGSSYLMAQQLDKVASGPLAHLLGSRRPDSSLDVLELGSGTGLLGLAAAAMWQANVVLSDLPSIMANLEFNIDGNRQTIEALGGTLSSGPLTWGSEAGNAERFAKKHQFKLVIVADPLYDDDHPELLSSAVTNHLSEDPDARAIIMVPQRDSTTKRLTARFRTRMVEGVSPLRVLEEHTLACQDDWDEDEETPEVQCWWGVFGRQDKDSLSLSK
ncbi:Uu.00g028420.m01.CDS01 [Anthostomella pinea]|uniref:Uu.00g028420.m01.CDS01 n=1 Tax=Anthostomella pinea TaxID=933095 RepID=A0AAI8V7S9_9PEZI|nr:Uu.00g028420.m01.CDS01 [Anthostomella pinea]